LEVPRLVVLVDQAAAAVQLVALVPLEEVVVQMVQAVRREPTAVEQAVLEARRLPLHFWLLVLAG
jgi:hypothetical protein